MREKETFSEEGRKNVSKGSILATSSRVLLLLNPRMRDRSRGRSATRLVGRVRAKYQRGENHRPCLLPAEIPSDSRAEERFGPFGIEAA
jgi:hypothetical protein